MRYELMIAIRHLTSKRGRGLSLVSALAVAGVGLGVAALVGGFAVTAGFEDAFREKILGVTAHVLARPHSSARYDHQEIEKQLKRRIPELVGVSPTTYHKAVLSGAGGTVGGMVKSLIPEAAQRVLDGRADGG